MKSNFWLKTSRKLSWLKKYDLMWPQRQRCAWVSKRHCLRPRVEYYMSGWRKIKTVKRVIELGCDLVTQDKEIRLHRYIRDWNVVLFCWFDWFLFLWDRVSCSPGQPQAHYKLGMALNLDLPASALPSAEITGVCHHTWFIQWWWLNTGLLVC